MRLTIKRLVSLGLVFASAALMAAMVIVSAHAGGSVEEFDAAGTYKAKCFACHGAAAEKRFDTSLTDDQLFEAVMKGKKPEKPPNMPAYEEKGVTADQAKALIAFMKSLKS